MIRLFQSIIDRVKAMFTLDAVLDLEQQFIQRQAERKAQILRQADHYRNQGMIGIANDLRRQAEELSERQPLQIVAPFLGRDFSPKPRQRTKALADDRPKASDTKLLAASPGRKKGK